MSIVLADRVQETTTTTGTGTINLGGAVTQFQSFVTGVGNGNQTYYCLVNGNNWEVGVGTVTSGSPSTLSRTTILASSNSGSAISLFGTSIVFGDAPAALLGILANGTTGSGNIVLANAPALSGTVSGTYTLGGTPTIELATANNLVIDGSGQEPSAVVHPLQGGVAPAGSPFMFANANNDINADTLVLISTDPSSVGVTVEFGGTTAVSGDVIGFQLIWTGSGSPVSVTYTASGGETPTTIAGHILTKFQTAPVSTAIASAWGAGYPGNADLGGSTFGVNVPLSVSPTLSTKNISSGSGNITLTINGTLCASGSSAPPDTALDPGNCFLSIARDPGVYPIPAGSGIGAILFQSKDSNGNWLDYFASIGAYIENDTAGNTQGGMNFLTCQGDVLTLNGGLGLSDASGGFASLTRSGGLTLPIPLAVADGGTGDTGTAWTSYTPTLSGVSGGTPTATLAGRYKQIGKTVFLHVKVDVSALNGASGGNFQVSLPISPTSSADVVPMAGYASTGGNISGTVEGGLGTLVVNIALAVNTCWVSGVYEST